MADNVPDTVERDRWQALEKYLQSVAGVTCVVPLERIRELLGAGLPDAARSPGWWTDAVGWEACPASGLCREAGWRVESVHPAGAVRFGRVAGK
ncbi:MAG: hypothetical protein F4Y02_10755 [Chloroflexi bacterium]|nr:hypothetical protein [Chloroflexota bacterium]